MTRSSQGIEPPSNPGRFNIFYTHAVATTWSMSRGTISAEAAALLQLLSFFPPKPVSEGLLVQPTRVTDLPEPLAEVLGDIQLFRRAARELTRFSLLEFSRSRSTVQVHRVVQAVTRSRLEQEDPATAETYRRTVHTLIAVSTPRSPDNEKTNTPLTGGSASTSSP